MFRLSRTVGNSSTYLYCCDPLDVSKALDADGMPTDFISDCNTFKVQHGREPNTLTVLLRHHSSESDLTQGLGGIQGNNTYKGILTGCSKTGLNFYDPANDEAFPEYYNFSWQHLYQTNVVFLYNIKERDKVPNVGNEWQGFAPNRAVDNSIVMATFKDIRHYLNMFGPPSKGFNILRHSPQCNTITPLASPQTIGYGDKYYTSTLRTDGKLWTFAQVMQWLLDDFNRRFQTYRTQMYNDHYTVQFGQDMFSTTLDTYTATAFQNFWSTGKSYLQCITDLCQHYRLFFWVDSNGTLVFGNKNKFNHDTASQQMANNERSQEYYSFTSKGTSWEGFGKVTSLRERIHIGNEDYVNRPNTGNLQTPPHPLLPPTSESTSGSSPTINITMPYNHSNLSVTSDSTLGDFYSISASNTTFESGISKLRQIIQGIQSPSVSLLKKHIKLPICFNRDQIIYSQKATACTIVKCLDPFKHDLNYINPPMEWYNRAPQMRRWLARATVVGGSVATLMYTTTLSTGVHVDIIDENAILSDVVVGDVFTVLEDGRKYYALNLGCDDVNISSQSCTSAHAGTSYPGIPSYPSF